MAVFRFAALSMQLTGIHTLARKDDQKKHGVITYDAGICQKKGTV